MNPPAFRYHPDPFITGSIDASKAACISCGEARGFIYVGPVQSTRDLKDALCPWCIADGAAHRKFECSFTDDRWPSWIPGGSPVPRSAVEEVSYRTPGFMGWQQERWLACCGDAAAFLGPAGKEELQIRWPDAIPSIKADSAMDDEKWSDYFDSLSKESSPTAYVFRCLHCRRHLGYSDTD